MCKALVAAFAVVVLSSVQGAGPARAEQDRYYVVGGVAEDDMLKMRAGPGVGYRLIVGLPNGTVLRVYSCEQTGSTRWCKVALKEARGLKGYVSRAYLQDI